MFMEARVKEPASATFANDMPSGSTLLFPNGLRQALKVYSWKSLRKTFLVMTAIPLTTQFFLPIKI
jgi:hypothetical protein